MRLPKMPWRFAVWVLPAASMYLSSHGRVSSMLHVRKINLADFLQFEFEVSTRQKCRRVKFCVYSWVLLFLFALFLLLNVQ